MKKFKLTVNSLMTCFLLLGAFIFLIASPQVHFPSLVYDIANDREILDADIQMLASEDDISIQINPYAESYLNGTILVFKIRFEFQNLNTYLPSVLSLSTIFELDTPFSNFSFNCTLQEVNTNFYKEINLIIEEWRVEIKDQIYLGQLPSTCIFILNFTCYFIKFETEPTYINYLLDQFIIFFDGLFLSF